jgi:hypothetical protein
MRRQLWVIGALLVAGVGLVTYIFFYEIKNTTRQEQTVEKSRQLFSVVKDSVAELQVRSGAEDYTIVRSASGWDVVRPLAVPAKTDEVERLLGRVLELRKTETIGRPTVGLADFGLGPARVAVSLWTRGHVPVTTVLFGDRNPARDQVYVMLTSDSAICLVGADVLYSIEKKLFDLRDRDLCGFERDRIAKLEVTVGPAAPVVLKRTADYQWSILSPVQARARRQEVDRLLDKLVYSKADEIAAEEAPALKTYGLDPAQVRVGVWDRDDNMTILLVGKPTGRNDTYFAKRADRRAVYVVGQTVWECTNRPLAALRDTLLAEFDQENVNSLKVTVNDTVYACSRSADTTWQMDKPRMVTGPDVDRAVNELLAALKKLAWRAVASDQPASLAPYGLASGVRQVEIWFNKTTPPLSLLFGAAPNTPADRCFCKPGDSQSVYQVSREPLDKIGQMTGLK